MYSASRACRLHRQAIISGSKYATSTTTLAKPIPVTQTPRTLLTVLIQQRKNIHTLTHLSYASNDQSPTGTSSAFLTVTDPLLIYQSQVAQGCLKGDAAQFRAAKEFQSLYYRLRDYTPPKKAEVELRRIIRQLESKYQTPSHHSRASSYYATADNFKPEWLRNAAKRRASKKLVKVLDNDEELDTLNAPRGFLLNGEVGCGKSMLMDMFATSLPYASKGRWHYHNFMLWVYNQINLIQQRRNLTSTRQSNQAHPMLGFENEVVLFEVALTLLSQNTVLMLDEFALPDIAAAKIIKLLFSYFFRLGGVLVATSNRMPEDLYATDFRKLEFRGFLTVLQKRCNTLDMQSENDYRKILSQEGNNVVISRVVVKRDNKSHGEDWQRAVNSVIDNDIELEDNDKSKEDRIVVYGREVVIPWHHNGIAKFDFDYICKGLYGPADYISLASKYHTFIIDNVPVFKINMKSEARRFITLLDALYESRCQLVVRVAAPLDELFFPDGNGASAIGAAGATNNGKISAVFTDDATPNIDQVQVEEMYSKTQLDLIAPYRPNVSTYDDGSNAYRDQHEQLASDESKGDKHGQAARANSISKEEINFTNTKRFTGEDEKFAYRRAVSRVEEMTKSQQWRTMKQWLPVSEKLRVWEASNNSSEKELLSDIENNTYAGIGVNERQQHAPELSANHFWSVGIWGEGKRLKDAIAKKWIRGVEGR